MGDNIVEHYIKDNSPALRDPAIVKSYIYRMDTVEEIRRAKLVDEIKRRGYGGQAQIGRDLGVSPAQIYQWAKGVGQISSSSARRLEKALGRPTGWMDQADDGAQAVHEPSNISPGPDLRAPVPLISWVQAGEWTECTDPFPPGMADEWISPSTRVSKCAFAVKVRGDSMEPRFFEGETLIVDPEIEARSGDFVIVRLDDAQEATFKQLILDGPQKFLKPVNPRYPVIPINGNASIVGVVVEKRQVFLR